MWLIFGNVHMKLKVKAIQLKAMQLKAMQLKVSMQKNIGKIGIKEGYMFTPFFSSFFLLSSSSSGGEKLSLILELEKLLSCKESLILVSKRKKNSLLAC